MEGYFYSVETEPDLDDKITLVEEKVFSPLIDRLRRGELDDVSIRELPDLLAHFEIRSRHVRQNMASAGDACVECILQRMADPEVLAQLLRPHLTLDSPAFAQAIGDMANADQIKQLLAQRPDLLSGELFDVLVPGSSNEYRGAAAWYQRHDRACSETEPYPGHVRRDFPRKAS